MMAKTRSRPPLVVPPVREPDASTKEGWKYLVDTAGQLKESAAAPARLSAEQIDSLSDEQWQRYGSERLCWFQEAPYIWLPAVDQLWETASRRLNMNARGIGARAAIALDGPSGVGKTSMLWLVGRRYELLLRSLVDSGAMQPPQMGERAAWCPVVYLQLNARANPRNFNAAFVESYGPLGIRSDARTAKSAAQLSDVLSKLVRRCGTVLVLIDDIHFFFWMREDARAEIFNNLKALASRLGVTFIFAGVELRATGFFSEGTKLLKNDTVSARFQVAGRTSRIPVEPFSTTPKANHDTWRTVISFVESRMILGSHRPQTLARELSQYLYERTGGRIHPLTRLLGEATELAISGGSERVDKELLDRVVIDEAAEQHRQPPSGRRAA